jgi:hypothetical protein
MGIDGTCRLARRKKSSPEVVHRFSEAAIKVKSKTREEKGRNT